MKTAPAPDSPAFVGRRAVLLGGNVQVPLAGDKPQRYISPSALGCRCSGDGGWCRRPVPESIPDRSSGRAFVPTFL